MTGSPADVRQQAARPASGNHSRDSLPRPAANAAVVPDWARKLAHHLDDAIRIPGTNWRIGWDGIIGLLLPTAGDTLTAVGAVSLLVLALRSGVPTVILGRMVLNIAIDALIGSIPILGDWFDFAFKANRRNLELLEQYEADPERRPGVADYALVVAAIVLVVLSVVVPLLLALTVFGTLGQWLTS